MRRVNVIPMAGLGQRFVDAGFDLPKPLIPIDGVPMVLHAAKCLPPADHWVFVCRSHHLEDSALLRLLESEFPGCEIVEVEELTAGQAASCLLAAPSLEDDDSVTFGACDTRFDFSHEHYFKLLEEADAIVFTVSPSEAMLANPRAYGWVKQGIGGAIEEITCKKPASDTPDADQVIIGSFGFARGATFVHAVQDMMDKDIKVRGEYYMDTAIENARDLGYRVEALRVDRFDCWGTPEELFEWQEANR